jgi:hypothetical protein
MNAPASTNDAEEPMKILIFLTLMSIFIGASYFAARRDTKARSGSALSNGGLLPRR